MEWGYGEKEAAGKFLVSQWQRSRWWLLQGRLQLWSLATVACVICATCDTLGSLARVPGTQQRQIHMAWEWPGTALGNGVLYSLSLLLCWVDCSSLSPGMGMAFL